MDKTKARPVIKYLQTFTSKFKSHWVPFSYGHGLHLNKNLCKLIKYLQKRYNTQENQWEDGIDIVEDFSAYTTEKQWAVEFE